jgi:uncharacterized membrane protein YgdD (TMEM256/DUF423 family)
MKIKAFFLMSVALGAFACTDLKETLNEDLTKDVAEEYLNSKADVSLCCVDATKVCACSTRRI